MTTKKEKITPDLTLSMDDKIYLAVAKNTTGKTAFVYTLACLQSAPTQYNLLATREIHSFKNVASAQLYYDTVEKIVKINASDARKK